MADDAPATVERLLRLLAGQTKEHAIMFLNVAGRITWWNSGAERIFGIPRDDALGQFCSVVFTPEDIVRNMPEFELATATTVGAAEDDRWLARADGSRFWASGAMVALRDAHGELLGFGKVLRDRTDLKEQLETLRNQVEAANASGRRKDAFLSTLSHELRSPLAPLRNAVQLMRLTAPATPELEYPLGVIDRQIGSLERLVGDLLSLSRIGAGKIELHKQVVALRDVIQRAVERADPVVRAARHKLDVLLPSAPIFVEADPDRLEQIFVNLVVNAAKYTPEGGRIWIKGAPEGKEAIVQIEDTGIGIEPEMLPRIFELFTQVESSRPQSQGGLGIGLSLVKDLVALHGGSVQVRSEGPGKGSEFTVRLPLSAASGKDFGST